MFSTIRRHQSWLWLIIIFLVILSFVWYMGPSAGSSGGFRPPTGTYGYLKGRAIEQEDYWQAHREARIQFFLYARVWPESSPAAQEMFDAERQVAERLVLIDKLRELKVTVPDDAVARWIARLFTDPTRGVFNPELYRQFVEVSLRSGQLSEESFRKFARNEVGVRHLTALGGLSGALITPREAEAAFRRENEQIQVELASFSLSNHLAEVLILPERLTNFFNLEASRYRVPDKVRVSYAHFPTTNFIAQAEQELTANTNLHPYLEAQYRERGPDTFIDATGQVLSPEAAKERLRLDVRENLTQVLARREAMAFGEELIALFESRPQQPDLLEGHAAAKGLPSGVTPPFARFERPPGLLVGSEFAQAAFGLSTNQPLALEPLVGQDGVYLIAFKERIPGYVPPFDQVQQSVTTDYRREEARKLALEAATRFFTAATNALAQSQSFDLICSNANVIPIKPPPFASSTQSLPSLAGRIELAQLKEVALGTSPGQLSPLQENRDGAFLVYVASRSPVDDARVKAELPGFMDELRADRRQNALGEWFRKELDLAQVTGLPEELRKRRGPAPR
jgi:hypothetical protein